MSIQVFSDGHPVPVSSFIFKGGEVQVNVKIPENSSETIYIFAILKNSDDIMNLLMITDAIKQQTLGRSPKIVLEMPYVPYARQDRVMNPGESLSIKVFCNLINSQEYTKVIIHDPHSDVTSALLDKVVVKSQAEVMAANLPFGGPAKFESNRVKAMETLVANTVLVSPDAGANKKIGDIAKTFGFEHVVRADKVRDTKTNKILETVVYSDHVGDKDFLIVDDIVDGGRTFIELAKVLRPLTNGKIILYATHGIFSYGLEVFKDVIDEVYCSHSFGKYSDNINLMEIKS